MIVGLLGNARVGKDTFAEHLVKQYGYVRIGLADPLKRFCKEVFDFSDEQLYGNERDLPDTRYLRIKIHPPVDEVVADVNYLTPRYALQTLGTEWGRNCYNDIWIETGIRTAKRLLEGGCTYAPSGGLVCSLDKGYPPPNGVVFADLRFKNEFEAVRLAGGVLVRIYRPEQDGTNLAGVKLHPSEEEQRSIPDAAFDYIINNDGTLEDYTRKIDQFMSSTVLKRS